MHSSSRWRTNLIKLIPQLLGEAERADQLKNEVTQGAPPPSVVESTIAVQNSVNPMVDLIGPSYVLGNNYYFLDWMSNL